MQLATEYPPPEEQRHIDSLIASLRGKMERDYVKSRMLRDAHPKMHGCVRGEFTVLSNLTNDLKIGLFKENRTYPVWIRFSNQNNTPQSDSKGDIRGLALKLMGVEGEKLLSGSEHDTTHDFILFSDSRFVTRNVAEFDGLVIALIKGGLALLGFFLTHPRAARNMITSFRKHTDLLAIRYFSAVPSLLGPKAVKYSLIPGDGTQPPPTLRPSDGFLREAMVNRLRSGQAVFDFAVQFQLDPDKMPIEDPGITWDEKLSPFHKVATVTIPPQEFDTPERREFGDNLSFNPWRCLPEHRPLGGISRARRQIYDALSKFRHERNRAPRVEPTA